MKRDCAKKKASDARKNTVICHHCKEFGHYKRVCPHLARPGGQTGAEKVPSGVSRVSRSPVSPADGLEARNRTGQQVERRNMEQLRGRSSKGLKGGHDRAGLKGGHDNAGLERGHNNAGLEGGHGGIGAGSKGAHARIGAEEHTRNGTMPDKNCSGNGTKLECIKNGTVELLAGCGSNGAPLEDRSTSSGVELGRSSTGGSGVDDLASVQGGLKTDAHGGGERGQNKQASAWIGVPGSAVQVQRVPAQTGKTDRDKVGMDCSKVDAECGQVTGTSRVCVGEHIIGEMKDCGQWHETIEGRGAGQEQPLSAFSSGESKKNGENPAPLLEVEREGVLNGNVGREQPLTVEPEKGDGSGYVQGLPNSSDSAIKDLLEWPSLSDAAKKGRGGGSDQEWPRLSAGLSDAAKKGSGSEWSHRSVGPKENYATRSRFDREYLPSGNGHASEKWHYSSEERNRWPHSSEDRGNAAKRQPLPPFVDTHCHLEYVFERYEHQGSFASFKAEHNYPRNFEGCIASFCDPAAFSSLGIWSQLLFEGGPGIWAAFGIHPHNAKYYSGDLEEKILKCVEHEKCVAFGEIGLDYGPYSPSSQVVQKDIFAHQLQLGVALGKPLVLHCRDAEEDLLRILSAHVPSDWKIHLHCFTGKPNTAFRFLRQFPNLHIGITGSVTYDNSYNVRNIARSVPLERLLVETDAPYNTPRNLPRAGRCRFSHPAHAYYVAKEIANLKGVELREVLWQVRENTANLYGI